MEEPAGGVLGCCGGDGAELEGKTLDLPVDPHSSLTDSHKLYVVTETRTDNKLTDLLTIHHFNLLT